MVGRSELVEAHVYTGEQVLGREGDHGAQVVAEDVDDLEARGRALDELERARQRQVRHRSPRRPTRVIHRVVL